MTNIFDFPTWFNYGCYSGLACCMLAIAVSALYTTFAKRGTTRQLALAIVASVAAALLLLPALLWFNLRFSAYQATLSAFEIGLLLAYVAFCGLLVPCGVTLAYCLFTMPRMSSTAGHLPRWRKRTTRTATATVSTRLHPPRRQPGQPSPFVYSSDRPWGWLVYRNGKFAGQELALKHIIVSIGREEDNEVWLDDDTVSRYHAELAWEEGRVTVTDADSLNGVLLNGERIRFSTLLKPGDELGIGGHRFWLKYAQQASEDELADPLLPQLRRVALARNAAQGSSPTHMLDERPLAKPTVALDQSQERLPQSPLPEATSPMQEQDVAQLQTSKVASSPLANAVFTPPFALRLPSKPEKEKSMRERSDVHPS